MLELKAVNYLLGVLGSSPVGALTNKNPDVSVAQEALEDAIVVVTTKGYWFNEVYNVDFTPDPVTKYISTTGFTKLITRNYYGVVRGNDQLFDPKNNTYQWTETVTADAVAILTFAELPDIVQLAVMYYAATQLCSSDLEDTTKLGENQQFYNNAYVQMLNDDLEIKRLNKLNSPRTQRALHRIRPARLNGRGGPNFGGR